jgi:catechol 2,3-dioxygenase-like lactoylglutathione lyase family enzyme
MASVRYLVSDVAAATEFYTGHLGFELKENWGGAFAIVARAGEIDLWLSGPQSSAARPMANGDAPVPGGWNRLVLKVKNLDEMVESMASAGVRFRNSVVDGPGGRQVLIEDPSGNIIELFEPSN